MVNRIRNGGRRPTAPDIPAPMRLKKLRDAIRTGPTDMIQTKTLSVRGIERLRDQEFAEKRYSVKIIEAAPGRLTFHIRGVEGMIVFDPKSTSARSPIRQALSAAMPEARSVNCDYLVGQTRHNGIKLSIPKLVALAGIPEDQLNLGIFSPASEAVGATKMIIEKDPVGGTGKDPYRHKFILTGFRLLDVSALLYTVIENLGSQPRRS